MAGRGASEEFQYKFEVQEVAEGGDGEVIIIYSCDGEEITPDLLAKTLEELSTQLSLQRAQSQEVQIVAQENVEAVSCAESMPICVNVDSNLLSEPAFKVEVCGTYENLDIGSETLENNVSELSSSSVLKNNDFSEKKDILTILNTTILKDNRDISNTFLKEDNSTKGTEHGNVAEAEKTQTFSSLPIVSLARVHFKEEAGVVSEEEEQETDFICDKCSFTCQIESDFQKHQKREHKVENPFVCRHCGKAFCVELSLSIHKLAHSQRIKSTYSKFMYKVLKFFTCPLCDFQYQKKRQLNVHIKNSHDNVAYISCFICNYSCLTDDELVQHMSSSSHDEEGRVNCPLCGTATKDIKQHLRRTHNDDRPYLCTQCGFKAKTITHLNNHMVIHDPVKRIHCDLCDYQCRTKDQLKKHYIKHSADKAFKCNLCTFACKTNMGLKRHMLIHKTPNKYVCNVCEFTTHDKIILRQHKAQKHILKASYKCRQCDCQFDRVIELKKHALAEHKSEKTDFCSYCDFAGQTPAELRTHMQTHFGKFSYTCSICGYMCRLKASYHRHLERHNKVKKFMCTLCSYASVEKYDLQKHYVHRHSDDKPLSCPYCSYRCKFKTRLNNHISYVHTDVKPFFCKLCPYSGKSAENLKKHMANHGVVLKTLRCVLCDYCTAEKAKLKRHMQVHVKKAVFQNRKELTYFLPST